MERTPQRRYSYPECDPPLVKDRADVPRWMRDLAVQVNGDVGTVANRIFDWQLKPDSARIQYTGGPYNVGGGEFTFPFNFVSYDTTGSQMGSVTDNGIYVRYPGWYAIYSYVQGTNVGNNGLMVRHLKNNQPQNRFEGPAFPVVGNDTNMTTFDIWPLQTGDLIQTRVRIANLGFFSYNGNLQVTQLLRTDV